VLGAIVILGTGTGIAFFILMALVKTPPAIVPRLVALTLDNR